MLGSAEQPLRWYTRPSPATSESKCLTDITIASGSNGNHRPRMSYTSKRWRSCNNGHSPVDTSLCVGGLRRVGNTSGFLDGDRLRRWNIIRWLVDHLVERLYGLGIGLSVRIQQRLGPL